MTITNSKTQHLILSIARLILGHFLFFSFILQHRPIDAILSVSRSQPQTIETKQPRGIKRRSKHYYYSMHIMKASTAFGLTLLLLICNAWAEPFVAQNPQVANPLIEVDVSYSPSEWANHQTQSMGMDAAFSAENSHPFETVDWLADCTFRLVYTFVNRNLGLRMGKNLWNLAQP